MKAVLLRDKKTRNLYSESALLRKMLKYILVNASLTLEIRFRVAMQLENKQRQSSIVRLHNRCVKTNRGKSVVTCYRLSRIFFLNFARLGRIVGLTKKSW